MAQTFLIPAYQLCDQSSVLCVRIHLIGRGQRLRGRPQAGTEGSTSLLSLCQARLPPELLLSQQQSKQTERFPGKSNRLLPLQLLPPAQAEPPELSDVPASARSTQ